MSKRPRLRRKALGASLRDDFGRDPECERKWLIGAWAIPIKYLGPMTIDYRGAAHILKFKEAHLEKVACRDADVFRR